MNLFEKREDFDHDKREEMIMRSVAYLKLSEAETYSDLEIPYKRLYCYYKYDEIIRPLVRRDRQVNGLSYPQLSIKYGLSSRVMERICRGIPKAGD